MLIQVYTFHSALQAFHQMVLHRSINARNNCVDSPGFQTCYFWNLEHENNPSEWHQQFTGARNGLKPLEEGVKRWFKSFTILGHSHFLCFPRATQDSFLIYFTEAPCQQKTPSVHRKWTKCRTTWHSTLLTAATKPSIRQPFFITTEMSGHRHQVRQNSAVYMGSLPHMARHHALVLLCHHPDTRIIKYQFWNHVFKLKCPRLHRSPLKSAFITVLP